MNKLPVAIVVLSILVALPGPAAADDLKVMTQNQYLGASLNELMQASDPQGFNAAMVMALRRITANEFSERAVALAGGIASRQPHLVGLQEVFTIECLPIRPDACQEPSIAGAFHDHLEETLRALAAAGATYREAATVANLRLSGVPIDLDTPGPGEPLIPDALINLANRNVILARSDVTTRRLAGDAMEGGLCGVPILPPTIGVSAPSGDGCTYAMVARIPSPLGPITLRRGFVGVDAAIDGRTHRFINTHLEVRNPAPIVQTLQAAELIGTLRVLTPPSVTLVVAGDINSSPDDPIFVDPQFGPMATPSMRFAMAGFTDSWDRRPGSSPGFTCCQLADLSNPTSLADRRIDVILSREIPGDVKANMINNEPSDKTSPSRLWPSDHAAVVATLTFE